MKPAICPAEDAFHEENPVSTGFFEMEPDSFHFYQTKGMTLQWIRSMYAS